MKLWRVGVLLCLLGCSHVPETPGPTELNRATAHYTVTIFDNFGGAKVRVCLKGATVRELVPIGDSSGRELSGAWIDGETLDTARGRIRLRQPSRVSCVDYETRFGSPMFRASESAAIIVSQTQWLWRPDPFPPELDASVRFVLPGGGQASLPWPSSDATYFPEESAFFISAFGAFGSFDRQTFSVAGTNVDITRLGPSPPDDDIRRWIGRAMQATASVGDRFPRDQVHFLIAPVQSQGKQVVFGMVRRGGGSSILLVPSPDASVEQLEADWVAVHELSHLWLPPLRSKDRWISEGIATYLQEVLRARCGLQSSERAWMRLEEGFARGRRSGTGRQLASESRNMNRTGAYHRVYWAGTAFALEVDVRLRKDSNGEMTLLRAISGAQRVWGTEARPVAASVVLNALQDASGAEFIEGLGEKYAKRSDFPGVGYVDSPEYRQVRAQITSRADHACGISAESSR
jgi:hypothetical protein